MTNIPHPSPSPKSFFSPRSEAAAVEAVEEVAFLSVVTQSLMFLFFLWLLPTALLLKEWPEHQQPWLPSGACRKCRTPGPSPDCCVRAVPCAGDSYRGLGNPALETQSPLPPDTSGERLQSNCRHFFASVSPNLQAIPFTSQ